MKNKVIPNPILPAAGVRRNIAADGGAGPPSGGQHDPKPAKEGPVRSQHPVQCTHALSETIRNGNLQCMYRTRVHTDDRIVYRRVERCTFITASAWRNEAQAATGGVGLMLGPLARKALRRVYHHTDRILIAEFSGNLVTTVIVVYSPTNVAPSEEVEKFYEDLATAVRDVPVHNFLAILGDFNARLGPEDAPYPYHGPSHGTRATGSEHLFRKRTGKRWTFQDRATGMLRQLDYILVRQKWRNSILNAEPYSTFSSVAFKPGIRRRLGSAFGSWIRERSPAANTGFRLCVPVLDRARTSLRSRHPEVVAARGRVEEARLNFELEPTLERRGVLNEPNSFSSVPTIPSKGRN
ncbi:Craniofacial development protein 2 [Dissostichus eleginoides]|uniref:Craniofacial development protein 2 n=1 Tax=Dissostichus eleginoides TaxID=100907 RepID=A0AAD9FH18_DISEL|nr:Craniofacial development protein 2 [Dissostichus eleginoides]